MRILLTGSTGFIGGRLGKDLESRGHQVSRLVRNKRGTDGGEMLFEELPESPGTFDRVVHLATCFLVRHDPSTIGEILESNVVFSAKILDYAARMKVPAFLTAGTYWQTADGTGYSPVNFYAATKQAFEEIARFFTETIPGFSFNSLALNDTYGPGDRRKKIFNLWRDAAESGERLRMSPGTQKFETLYIDDVVAGFRLLTENPYPGFRRFSLKSEKNLTLRETAAVFEQASGRRLNIDWGALPPREREIMNPTSPYPILPGWKQNIPLEEGIRRFLHERI